MTARAASDPAPQWRATYRVQLTATFRFDDVADLLPYLKALGISHLYLSPVLEAVTGSTHGYDVTDPTRISAERGGEVGFRRLAAAARLHHIGILLDIVPNHLAAHPDTPWWNDPLARREIFDVDPDGTWYRRFFDIGGLAGVRQEDPDVFDRTHQKILQLVDEGLVHGLRVDHPDGLADPAGYLERLHERAGVPIWVEKILQPGEQLRPWPVEGTVGYELANELTALFTDPAGEAPITATYQALTGDCSSFAEVAAHAKREQLLGAFADELARLVALVPDVDAGQVAGAAAALGVYRTYVVPERDEVAAEDRDLIEATGAPPALRDRLLLDGDGPSEAPVRFQQLTAPVTAKGVEDTAFYRSVRLLSHNEVGGDPGRWTISVDELHQACATRATHHPGMLLAATTHDTKRSADTRARIAALASVADAFDVHVRRWFALTDVLVGTDGPTPRERWWIFQTLIGSWPITADRLGEHLVKALREAGEMSSWAEPDHRHEAAVLAFARDLFQVPAFWADFRPFAEQVAQVGEQASAAQTLLRATTPGVCDTYQGDESWFLSLVDPDVRRSTDLGGRRLQLAGLRATGIPTRATTKLHVLDRALDLRRRRPDPFEGPYLPLDAGDHTVAFTRGDHEVLVVVPVRADARAALEVPPGRWRDQLGGGADSGRVRSWTGATPVGDLLAPCGLGLWERVAN